MKITLIKPAMFKRKSKDNMQPLAFAILSALTPVHINRVFYDERIEKIPFDEKTDLVALSVDTFSAKRAYQIAEIYRKKGVAVVMGGFHPSIETEEALEYADAVVVGDAEDAWPEFLNDWQTGQLKKIYKAEKFNQRLKTKYDRSIFHNKKYLPLNLVQLGRGCRYNCEFCSVNSFYQGKQKVREVNEVLKEISSLDNKRIVIVDDNVYHDKENFRNFLKGMCKLNKQWFCQISLDITYDEEMMELLKRSGCVLALVGIESIDRQNLRQMHKTGNLSILDLSSAILKFRKYGIMICGAFIFGYDYDTVESFAATVKFAQENKFAAANFNSLYLMPGTKIYERIKQEKRLLFNKWWLDNNYYYGKAMFEPKQINEQEFEQACFQAKKDFNSIKSIIKRGFEFNCNVKSINNLYLYLLINFINRSENLNKQGRILAS